MREAGLSPRKALGQHFLLDSMILGSIADAATLESSDTVLEVGMGLGSLTTILCERANRVIAVELDEKLVRLGRKNFAEVENLEIIAGDIFDRSKSLNREVLDALGDLKTVKMVANLPFQVATRLLLTLFERVAAINLAVVIVQREVAERLVATPGSKTYGPAGLLLGFWGRPEVIRVLPPGAFRPPPKVHSAVIRIQRPRTPWADPTLYPAFNDWVDVLFQQRRKQIGGLLRRNLGQEMAQKVLQSMNVDPRTRAEALPPEAFLSLARCHPRSTTGSGSPEPNVTSRRKPS